MKIAIHQPNFIPWLGYFQKIKQVDVFVFYDSVEYTKNSFINRNKILIDGQEAWLTIPVNYQGNSKKVIYDITINKLNYRPVKLLKTIEQSYGKTRYFSSIFPIFSKHLLTAQKTLNLAELNIEVIRWICQLLSIETTLVRSSELIHLRSDATENIISLCHELDADIYLSGEGSKKYLQLDRFSKNGLRIEYLDTLEIKERYKYLSVLHWLFTKGHELI